jgi:hypothetical protein
MKNKLSDSKPYSIALDFLTVSAASVVVNLSFVYFEKRLGISEPSSIFFSIAIGLALIGFFKIRKLETREERLHEDISQLIELAKSKSQGLELEESIYDNKPVNELSDKKVIKLTKLQMPAEEQETLNALLKKNREGTLTEAEERQLASLMEVYDHSLLRKSEALSVAVERGLIEPLSK